MARRKKAEIIVEPAIVVDKAPVESKEARRVSRELGAAKNRLVNQMKTIQSEIDAIDAKLSS